MRPQSTISTSKEPAKIQALFDTIAESYDRTNSVLSFQLHRYWNHQLTKSLFPCETLLDLCSGTGEIAYQWLKKQKLPKSVYFLDFCEGMLNQAEAKKLPYLLKGHSMHFIEADACHIPLPSNSIDAVSVAYGIRNIQDPNKCYEEVFRVLKPGGIFSILELTEPKNPIFRKLHNFYLSKILPSVGGWMTKQKTAYSYLASSILEFPKPTLIEDDLKRIGFINSKIKSLSFGTASLIRVTKPCK